jgi:1-acyl-sn-glycerol-3-phosphate acyltransferase
MKTLKIVLLSPLAFIRIITVLIMSAYVVTVGLIWMRLFGFSRRLQQWDMRTWGKSIMFFLGIKANVEGNPKFSNFILMPNHRSYLDIFIVAGFTPAAMVSKAEIKKWPFGVTGPKITNSILVDRSDIKSMINTMNKIKDSVDQGIPVTLFPEGTTFKGPLTKPFKNGSFKIAADTGIPIIPLAIHYNDVNDAWIDDDTFLNHFFRQMGKPFTKVSLKYGTPVSGCDYKILQEETKSQIDAMLREFNDPKI